MQGTKLQNHLFFLFFVSPTAKPWKQLSHQYKIYNIKSFVGLNNYPNKHGTRISIKNIYGITAYLSQYLVLSAGINQVFV